MTAGNVLLGNGRFMALDRRARSRAALHGFGHAGTTAVDVQVDLGIASGSVNTAHFELALLNAEFAAAAARSQTG